MNASEVLLKAAAVVRQKRWVPFVPARGETCAVLAVFDATNNDPRHATLRQEAFAYMDRVTGTERLAQWNDAPGRTADEVFAAFLRAAELADAAK